MPSPKEELVHKLFVWVNIDQLNLQNRHIKSRLAIAIVGLVFRFTIASTFDIKNQPTLTAFMQLSQYCSSSTDSPTSKYAICVGTLPQYTQYFLFMDRIFIMFSVGITNGSISRAFLPSVTIFLTYLLDRELLRIAAKFFEKFLLENIVSIFGKPQRKDGIQNIQKQQITCNLSWSSE